MNTRRKVLNFVNEIAGIMYVGGIFSHIVIGAVVGSPDPQTAVIVYTYKLMSAYILILPGLGLKVACDLLLFFAYNEQANWMKIKLAMVAFLSFNAFVFLMPMMPNILALANAAVPSGILPHAFHELEATEAMVGMSNVLPLGIEMVMGSFRPRIFGER